MLGFGVFIRLADDDGQTVEEFETLRVAALLCG